MLLVPDPAMRRALVFSRYCDVVAIFHYRDGHWSFELQRGLQHSDLAVEEIHLLETYQSELNT